jgi:uncharacterized protein YraI
MTQTEPLGVDAMGSSTTFIAFALIAFLAAQQAVPAALSALAEKAGLGAPITAWCKGEFRGGRAAAYAIAVPAAKGGRYVVLDPDGTVVELALFTGGAELSCYTPAAARQLHRSIAQSETIQGRIAPRWDTTVVCGFVEDTRSICWQYSPRERTFVAVGGWIT